MHEKGIYAVGPLAYRRYEVDIFASLVRPKIVELDTALLLFVDTMFCDRSTYNPLNLASQDYGVFLLPLMVSWHFSRWTGNLDHDGQCCSGP